MSRFKSLSCLVLVLGALTAVQVQADLRIGWNTPSAEFAKAWGVDPELSYNNFSDNGNLRINLIESNIPANIMWPGDEAVLTFQFENLTDQPLILKGFYDVDKFAARNLTPNKLGTTGLSVLKNIEEIPFRLYLPPKTYKNVTVEPDIPEEFGGYVVILDVEGQTRFFGTSLARTYKPDLPRKLFHQYTMDAHSIDQMARLGAYPNRKGIKFNPEADEMMSGRGTAVEMLKPLQEAGMTVTVEIGTAHRGQPLGMGRPHLDEDGVMKKGKTDLVWMPQYDEQFEEQVYNLMCEMGYPKGPINGVMLWNEPWEGLSISGWGADMIRYRKIYTHIAKAVERARKDAGVEVLIGGCDSSSNTRDKLLCDGTDEYLKWLDFMSIHYQGNSPGTTFKKFINRKSPRGRVLVWDTESWIANTEEGVAVAIPGSLSFGQDRVVGIYGGGTINTTNNRIRTGDGTPKVEVTHAWPINAAIGACQHFIGERRFKELVFKNGLPYVLAFNGMPDEDGNANDDDGTVVVIGNIGTIFHDREGLRFPYWTVRPLAEIKNEEVLQEALASLPADAPAEQRQMIQDAIDEVEPLREASMTITDGGGMFTLYDFYGNPLPSEDGTIVVPLNANGYYLRTDGSPGSWAKLEAAIKASRIVGYEPLATVCHDMTSRIGQGAAVNLELTNILNRPISGKLDVTLGELKLDYPQEVSFKANETKIVPVKVVGGKAVVSNTYPLSLEFDAGADGKAVHKEDMHVNTISHRTITVDGRLDDWKDALPQTIDISEAGGSTMEEAAWFPFAEMPEALEKGLSTGYVAYDDDYFYFAAKVADTTPDEGMMRFEDPDDDQFFYPEVCYIRDEEKNFQMKETTWRSIEREPNALDHPVKAGEKSLMAWTSVSQTFAVDMDLPENRYTQVTLYFVDWDNHNLGRAWQFVEVEDRDTGKQLDRRRYDKFGFGEYGVYLVSGKVRFIFRTRSWLPARVCGIFFDPTDAELKNPGTSLEFLKLDEATRGSWKGIYGKDGYNIIGAEAKYPQYVKVSVPEEKALTPLKWPEGVRRYSYRKWPELPSGYKAGGTHDNVLIAFNTIPCGAPEDTYYAYPPGTRPNYTIVPENDYEYALNPVAQKYGGGTEIWRLQKPGMPRKHFYPRQPRSPFYGPVENGKLSIIHEGNTRIVEAAIPWAEIPRVKQLLDAGKLLKFSYKVNDNGGVGCMELNVGRSVSKRGGSFHHDWQEHWTNQVEFSFEK